MNASDDGFIGMYTDYVTHFNMKYNGNDRFFFENINGQVIGKADGSTRLIVGSDDFLFVHIPPDLVFSFLNKERLVTKI
jgi:hypothetical protein